MPYRNDDVIHQIAADSRRTKNKMEEVAEAVLAIRKILEDSQLTDEERARIHQQLKGSKLIQ